MSLLIIGAVVIGAGLYTLKGSQTVATNSRLFNLPDVEPSAQLGNYKKDFDIYFEAAADEFGVPFALLKAHAFRESSFREKAFRDENPSKRTDRIGWASRGLMQLLFWPKSTRFAKYGFGPERNPDDLYSPGLNTRIAAQLIRDNLTACSGNVRDAVNMYNTGVKYSTRKAPENYTENVLQTYSTLIGKVVT